MAPRKTEGLSRAKRGWLSVLHGKRRPGTAQKRLCGDAPRAASPVHTRSSAGPRGTGTRVRPGSQANRMRRGCMPGTSGRNPPRAGPSPGGRLADRSRGFGLAVFPWHCPKRPPRGPPARPPRSSPLLGSPGWSQHAVRVRTPCLRGRRLSLRLPVAPGLRGVRLFGGPPSPRGCTVVSGSQPANRSGLSWSRQLA